MNLKFLIPTEKEAYMLIGFLAGIIVAITISAIIIGGVC